MSGVLALLYADEGYTQKTYVEDVFAVTTYSGTGSAQTIANGVALADSPVTQAFSAFAYQSTGGGERIKTGFSAANGALVWQKNRSGTGSHIIWDTARPSNNYLLTNTTDAQAAFGTSLAFSSDGYTNSNIFSAGHQVISWCFAKKAKFMDIVTFTAGSDVNRRVSHSLGQVPGLIMIKRTDGASDWVVYHRSLGRNQFAVMNLTNAANGSVPNAWGTSDPTSTDFGVYEGGIAIPGGTYVAYIFAHDSATDGMIQCGSFTTDGSGNATVNLGWRPQWLLTKRTGAAEDWRIVDITRAWPDSGSQAVLEPNTSDAEQNQNININPTSTGFSVGLGAVTGATYIYMAIRAPETSSTGGGMVWIKDRSQVANHLLTDTVRGRSKYLFSSLTNAEYTTGGSQDVTQFNGNGFSLGTSNAGQTNSSGYNLAAWTFKRSPKFFDVVQYTGDGVANRMVAHSLGATPGMYFIKNVTTGQDWIVKHRSIGTGEFLKLNSTDAAAASSIASDWATASTFSVHNINGVGNTYIAYLFAHDTSSSGLIQCGSFTSPASGPTAVTLGWEPQFLLYKPASGTGDWVIKDVQRGYSLGNSYKLAPNTSAAENGDGNASFPTNPTATGFAFGADVLAPSTTYIYLAIRRGPMRKPTSGTRVFSAKTFTAASSNAVTGVGFSPDAVLFSARNGASGKYMQDRLRGPKQNIETQSTNAEAAQSGNLGITSFDNDGFSGMGLLDTFSAIAWCFKRWPGVFDEVCFTSGSGTQGHNLTVAPELVILKARGIVDNWYVMTAQNGYGLLNSTAAWTGTGNGSGLGVNLANVSATSFSKMFNLLGTGVSAVAYLFSSLNGISKVGSYVGDGAAQRVIDCGFAAGARLVLLKRASSTSSWYVVDTTRGLTAGNDPFLLLENTAAENATADCLDPNPLGFEIATGSGFNAVGETWIYLALA